MAKAAERRWLVFVRESPATARNSTRAHFRRCCRSAPPGRSWCRSLPARSTRSGTPRKHRRSSRSRSWRTRPRRVNSNRSNRRARRMTENSIRLESECARWWCRRQARARGERRAGPEWCLTQSRSSIGTPRERTRLRRHHRARSTPGRCTPPTSPEWIGCSYQPVNAGVTGPGGVVGVVGSAAATVRRSPPAGVVGAAPGG